MSRQKHQMCVHIFGAISSPTTCLFALRQTAEDHQSEFPKAGALITSSFYVDNYLDSVESEEEAIQRAGSLKSLLHRGGFNLTKWMSSSRVVLSSIESEHLSVPNLNLDLDDLPIERTLGMLWSSESDIFFKIATNNTNYTKRDLASEIASIFDPLGLIAPIVVPAKVLLQETWKQSIAWNDQLPQNIQLSWSRWTEDAKNVSRLRIPRCLRQANATPCDFQLHTLTDASEYAFGAVTYLRTMYQDSTVSVSWIMAKSRVAPVHQLSIPRLELQAAVLGFELTEIVRKELSLNFTSTTYWSDSQTVLQWIYSKSRRFKAFVAHRVGQILDGSHPQQWRHVPGVLNPADDCSRGCSGEELNEDHRWFCGPPFLKDSENSWPAQRPVQPPEADDPEVATKKIILYIETTENQMNKLIDKISSLSKLERITVHVLRFIEKSKGKRGKKSIQPHCLVSELRQARYTCVRCVQQQIFQKEYGALSQQRKLATNSSLVKLSPYMDQSGVIRVGGRLDRSTLNHDEKHPMILPSNHPFTVAVIRHYHEIFMHSSIERTLTEIRSQYWILRGREAVKKIANRCFLCRKAHSQPQPSIMAALPPHRLQSFAPPFTKTGLYFFGPLQVIVNRRSQKRYGCLFTCLVTRAVHLEVTHTLSTDSFLLAVRRFISRRGPPVTIFSDNGTNIVGGERELREGINNLHQEKIENVLAAKHIEWRFSPPSAPPFRRSVGEAGTVEQNSAESRFTTTGRHRRSSSHHICRSGVTVEWKTTDTYLRRCTRPRTTYT